MMEWTDRHYRRMARMISRRTLLYTEMVVADAAIRGDRARLLGFDPVEQPVALQLGGSEPEKLAEAARIGADWGYAEINLNVGCPSDRVQSGRFGACLMAEPELVARCVAAMQAAVDVAVTVKTRIGVDDADPSVMLRTFVAAMRGAGVRSLAIHARKAWLKGLSPKENRTIPPLDYPLVHAIKAENPDLEIVINGGIRTLDEAEVHLARVDGAMIGRAAYEDPYMLAEADARIFADPAPVPTRHEVVRAMADYAEARMGEGVPLNAIGRHMLGLFSGLPGARAYRRHLSEHMHGCDAGPQTLLDAAAHVPEDTPAQARQTNARDEADAA